MKQVRSKGFTLTEVVLAIGVVGVLIVVFMAMFIPARRTVQAALTIREADRIVHVPLNGGAWRAPQSGTGGGQCKEAPRQVCFRL